MAEFCLMEEDSREQTFKSKLEGLFKKITPKQGNFIKIIK